MSWLKSQIGTILTAIVLLVSVGIAYGGMRTTQARLCEELQTKVDKEEVRRELDQLHTQMSRIESKLDQALFERTQ